MKDRPDARLIKMVPWLVPFACVSAAVAGGAGLLGWIFHITVLTGIAPGFVKIKANTCVCFILLAICFWYRREQCRSRSKTILAHCLAAVVTVIGVLNLLEILYGWNLGIDQLLIPESAEEAIGSLRPGLMSPVTAADFILLGTALLLLDWVTRRGFWLSQALALFAEALASLALLDFVLSPRGFHIHISPQAALLFCILPLGLIALRPGRGIGKLLAEAYSVERVPSENLYGRAVRPWYVRYGFAIATIAVATLLRFWLSNHFGPIPNYVTYFPALMLVCLASGIGPGLLTVFLSTACLDYFFLGIPYSFGVESLADSIGLSLFLISGVGYCLLLAIADLERRQSQAQKRDLEVERKAVQEQWKLTFDTVSDSVMLLDLDLRVRQANRATARLLGLKPEEVIGKHCYELIHQRHSPPENCPAIRLLKSGREERNDVDEPRLGMTFDVVATPLRDAEGNLSGCIHTVRDITQRKASEAAIARERQRFETVLDGLPAMVCLLTPDYHVSFANRTFRKQFGESQGRKCYEYCFGQSAPCNFCESYQVLKTNAPHDWEVTSEDGRRIHCFDFPFTDTDGSSLILEMNLDVTEQRQTEQKLREASQYARSLLEASLDPLVTISREGKIKDVNQATVKVAGVGREQLIGSDFSEYFTEPEKARQSYQRVFADGSVRDYPLAIRSTSGEITDVLYNASVYRDEKGEVEGVFAGARDITQRKRAEEELRESEKKYRALIETTETGYVILDPYGRVIDANPEYVRLTGHESLVEIAGHCVAEWTAPDHVARNTEAVRQCVERGFIRNFEIEYINAQDKRTPIEINATVVPVAGGTRILSLCRDISERKRIEDALRNSEEKFARTFRSAPTVTTVSDLDAEDLLLDVNEAFETVTGYRREEVVGRTVDEIGLWNEPAEHAAAVAQGRVQGGIKNIEMRFRRKNGEVGVALMSAETIEMGGRLCAITTAIDITERKQAEHLVAERTRQQQAVANLGQFALSATDLQSIMELAVSILSEVLRVEYCKVLELLPDGKALLLAGMGWHPGLVGQATLGSGTDSQAGYTLLSDQPVIVDDLRTETRFSGPPLLHEHGVVSGMSVVIAGGSGKPFGVLGAHTKVHRKFSAHDVRFLQEVANILGQAVVRNRAEAKLAAERQKFSMILDVVSPYVVLLTPDYHVAFANQEFRRRFGESKGRRCYEFLFNRSEPCEICETYKVLRTGKQGDWEWTGPDGRHYEIHDYPFTDTDGQTLILEMGIDITARKQAEDALRRSEARLQLQFERMPIGCIVWNKDFRVASWNPAAEAIFGFSAEEVMGRHPYDCIVPKAAEASIEQVYHRLLAGDTTAHSDNQNLTKDGRTIECHWTNTPLTEPSGSLIGILSMVQDVTERKRAEEALRKSEAELKEAQRVARLGHWTLDVSTGRVTWSEELYRMLGLDSSLPAPSYAEQSRLFTPESWAELTKEVEETTRTGKPYRLELETVLPDGSHGWMLALGEAIRDDQQLITRIRGIAQDITERKLAELARRRLQANISALIESTGEMIWSVDLNLGLLTFNENLRRHLENSYGIHAALGMKPEELFPPEKAPVWVQMYRRALSEGPFRIEYDALKDRVLDLSFNPVVQDGHTIGISVFSKDITERKRAEAALRESERKFSTLVDFVPQFVWMCTPDGLNFYFNQRWFDYTGLTPEESYGTSWNAPFHPDDKQAAWDAWNRATATGETYVVESRLRSADGTYRWFLMRGTPLRDEAGKIVRWFGTCTDIEDMKQAGDALQHSQRELSRLNVELDRRVQERTAELQAILDAAPIPIWIGHDPDSRRITGNIYADQTIMQTAGRSNISASAPPGEAAVSFKVLKNGRELRPEEMPAQMAATEGRPVSDQEVDIAFPDGRTVNLLLCAAPLFDTDGRVRGSVTAGVDITARKRMEEALRETGEKLERTRSLLAEGQRIAHLGTFEYIAATQTTVWSEEEYRIYGLDPAGPSPAYDTLLGKSIHPDDAALLDQTFKAAIQSRSTYELEHRIVRPDGSVRWVYDRAYPYFDETGKVVRYVGATMDITDRKRAEEALRESEKSVRRKLETILSPEGDIAQLELRDLLDLPVVQSLLDDYYKQSGITMALIDLKGKFLASTTLQDVCVKFHRAHPESCKNCVESDTQLSTGAAPGEFKLYKCKNNMWDVATPIIVGGRHLGNLFAGQFFFDDETVDYSIFRAQAKYYGFDEEEYIAAVKRAPLLSREAIDRSMAFMVKFAQILSQLGYSAIKQARAVTELKKIEWMLSARKPPELERPAERVEYLEPYGDLTSLNTSRLILDSVGPTILHDIARDYMELLETSAAIYEKNGDYALGMFTSGWCQLLDRGSRTRCNTSDNREALASGRWHCHESCWTKATRRAIETGGPVDIECAGGIRLHAVPIRAGQEIVGGINFGYGDPPRDEAKLQEIAAAYDVSLDALRAAGEAYESRPPYIIALAKQKLQTAAGLIGEIVQRRRVEQELGRRTVELEAVNKELESFNYAVAHDLRSPLRHIHGFSEILGEEARPVLGESAQHHLQMIGDSVRYMEQLLEDLLQLSRLGRQELTKRPCSLKSIVNEVVNRLKPEAKDREVEWRIGELPLAECDPALMRHVITNLLSNALKFTRTRSIAIIEIGETTIDGEEAIFVRDNGVGFNMKYMDKLFGLFQRLHRQEDFEGTGVGLAIAQRIMHRHGGRVWAEAEVNKGATFYLSLPGLGAPKVREAIVEVSA